MPILAGSELGYHMHGLREWSTDLKGVVRAVQAGSRVFYYQWEPERECSVPLVLILWHLASGGTCTVWLK